MAKKTAVMIFNISGRQLKESFTMFYKGQPVASPKIYCYLGICYLLSGSSKTAQIQLKQKGFRAYFALKKQLSLGSIQNEAVFKLFDALVMPIISYSFQTWGPSTEILKILANNSIEEINKIYLDPMESLHLSFLKWTIGVYSIGVYSRFFSKKQ